MNLIKAFICLTVIVFAGFKGNAQGKSLLWKVSGKGLSHASYIYGTIHIICSTDFEIKSKVAQAFSQSKKLVVEVDITDAKELQIAQQLMNTGKKLTDSLSDAEEKLLDSELRQQFKISLSQVDNVAPALLESMIANAAVKCKDKKTYEIEFIQQAKQQNKPVEQLESMEQQVNVMQRAFSASDVVKHIQLSGENEKLFSQMVTYYKNEDIEALETIAQDSRFMSPTAKHLLLDGRNQDWIKKMPAIMKNGPVFFAVGAIHLPGEQGLIELLKKDGYTLTPVLN